MNDGDEDDVIIVPLSETRSQYLPIFASKNETFL
jgi:hypothetical protein